jgi:FkbM family methyltransferase
MLRFKKADPAFSSAGVIRVKGGGGRDQKRRARNKPVVSIFTLVAALLLITSSAFVYQSLPVQGVEDGSSSIIKDLLVSDSFFLSVSETKNKSALSSSSKNEVQEGDSSSSLFSWESPHLLDCHQITTSTDDTNTDANDIFVATKTEPSFLMNIHNPKSDSVSNAIHKNGCWECNHIQEMLSALNKYPNSYFLDIGGNIGMWTLSAAAAKKQTFTIEPSPENYQRICKTVNKNSFHDRIHLLTVAATSQLETFRLEVPKNNKGGTMVIPHPLPEEGHGTADTGFANDKKGNDNDNGNVRIIKGVTIDSLNLPIDRPVVIKVDVEGHELQAFTGALSFLKSAQIVHVSMELRPLNSQWKELFDVLTSKGLVPFRIDGNGEEKSLDPNVLSEWKSKKHPVVRYYDVVWRMKD